MLETLNCNNHLNSLSLLLSTKKTNKNQKTPLSEQTMKYPNKRDEWKQPCSLRVQGEGQRNMLACREDIVGWCQIPAIMNNVSLHKGGC